MTDQKEGSSARGGCHRDHSKFCDDTPPQHSLSLVLYRHRGKRNDLHAFLCHYFSCFLLRGGHAERRDMLASTAMRKNVGEDHIREEKTGAN